jgi:hypothetical protein
MAKKNCGICGNPSGMYPLCKDCFKKRDAGEVKKCEECGQWYETKNDHECELKEQEQVKSWMRPQSDDYTRKVIMAEIPDNPDIRKKWEAKERCTDGHYVRSRAEVIIDNYLYNNHHVHAYEKKVFLPKNPEEAVIPDFYIPTHNVYIEFWGMDNEKYKERREHKTQLYEDNNINVIHLTDTDIKVLDDILPGLLHKYKK